MNSSTDFASHALRIPPTWVLTFTGAIIHGPLVLFGSLFVLAVAHPPHDI